MYKISSILGAVIALALGVRAASAQSVITPDTTLGTEASVVNSLNPTPIDIINGGAIRGNNLFHSFSQFNVGANREVYFFSPSANIANILARVTGGSRSEILGTLGTFGNSQPNLFLINPSGIIFGPNASLNVGKSFIATTADTIQFGNQGFFSATNPQAPPLLTVNPSALLFNQINNGTIINQSQAPAGLSPTGQQVTGLKVRDGNNLLLVGGNINIDGGALRAYSGNIELAGLETGNIQLDTIDGNPQLILPQGAARADVSLSNEAEVNVRGESGGKIKIYGRNINLTEASKLRAGIDTGLGTPNSKAEDIVIDATGTTTLTDNSFIANLVNNQAFGKAGDINITTESLKLRNNGYINANLYGQGSAGNISIKASDVSLIYSDIFSNVEREAIGNGGNINIKANSLELIDSSQLQTFVQGSNETLAAGRGNAGNINIDVEGTIKLISERDVSLSGIYSDLGTGAVGNGGNITIKSGTLSLTGGSALKSRTAGQGNAGSITINTRNSVVLDGQIISDVDFEGVGKAGDIQITAGTLKLGNSSFIDSSILGRGDAGNIVLNINDALIFDRSIITNAIFSQAQGNAGQVKISSGSLSMTNESAISSSNFRLGNAGGITIDVKDDAKLDNSQITSSIILSNAVGRGGDIRIRAGSFSAVNGSGIDSLSDGQGDAGNIFISTDSLLIENASIITSLGKNGQGKAGNIQIDARSLSLQGEKANIQSLLFGTGKGGDITINTDTLSLNNVIGIASATNGKGNAGNININTSNSIFALNSEIFSGVFSNGQGNAGDISIRTGSLSFFSGARLGTNALGRGNGGNINIIARDAVSFTGTNSNGQISGASSQLESTGVGKGGNIEISTNSLSLTDGAQLNSITRGQGDAGNITVGATGTVTLDKLSNNGYGSGIFTSVDSASTGIGGNINVNASALSISNNASLNSSSFGEGKAGNIQIDARDISLQGENASIESSLLGVGKGGDITINTETLSLENALGIFSATSGKGDAGNITLNASNSIFGENSRISSGVGSNGQGNAGDISIRTGSLSFFNGARLIMSTFGKGNAGNMSIIARDAASFTGANSNGRLSGASSQVESTGVGKGGNIEISTNSLSLTDGAQLNAITSGQGDAGNITVGATGAVTVDGLSNNGYRSGIFTSVDSASTGSGGDINVNARTLSISNNAALSSSSFAEGKAGDININTRSVKLDNRGIIAAVTNSSDGGNIKLTATDLLLLRRGSAISTTAGFADAGGNGGNITIDTPFIIALHNENSDITANAFTGRGGNVNINVQSIFGIEARASETLNSDITASSQRGVQGQINITQPEVQPTQGIIELPGEVVDASNQIGQMCPRGGYARRPLGEFIITGRGSLPPSPLEPLPGTYSLTTLVTIDSSRNVKAPSQDIIGATTTSNNNQIIEAQGWVKTVNGDVELVVMAPHVVPSGRQTVSACGERTSAK